MALDLDAIRKKLNQLSGQNNKRNTTWRPQEGEESIVRLMSFPDNDGQPFKERWFYYNIGNNPGLLAPYQFGQPDPIQELINKLRDDSSKESYELAKKLYPKMRCYAPVVVRGEEDKGVRVWSFGKTVYQTLLNIMLDEDYGDITDPLEGRDVKVTCTKPPGRMWATTDVRPRGKQNALSEDAKLSKDWLSSVPSLDDMYTCKTYDELEKIVNDWLNGDSDEQEYSAPSSGDSASKPSSDSPSSSDSGSSKAKYKSLDEAFADLEDL
jgi:hypothetical protein|tara:strand:- start:325 stop:1125 length:801 start_codon:yes stop_codon:yes gene_type:complete